MQNNNIKNNYSRNEYLQNKSSKRKSINKVDISNKKIHLNDSLDYSKETANLIQNILFKHRGITELYDWQIQCLKLLNADETKNLIYSLPTSGGKTLVAEIFMLKQLILNRKSVIFILPFVSLVHEKVKALAPFGLDLQFLVEEYAGGKGSFPPIKHRNCPSVYVATIEKAHSLVNSLIESNQIDRISLLVVDELHMIGDGSRRGANLELCLLKFMATFTKARIIGMSATLDNLEQLAQFLHAKLFKSDFRPIELNEYIKVDSYIYKINTGNKNVSLKEKISLDRTIQSKTSKGLQKMDPDNIVGLISEILPDKSCLIFCPSKKQCESLTNNIINLTSKTILAPQNKFEKRQKLINNLKIECTEVCPLLARSIMFGVAYHHSGLTLEERAIVEEGFLDGSISIICCTSTLAAGVNLPARRVIIRSPYVGSGFISYSQYKQMTGRAGRAGLDTLGESIVILSEKDKTKFGNLLEKSCSNCISSILSEDAKMVKYFALSAISLKLANNFDDLLKILKESLFNIQEPGMINEVIKNSLQYLIDNKLLKQVKDETNLNEFCLIGTELGRAVVRGSIDVTKAHDIYYSLKEAEKALNISSFLHMLYLVTPHDLVDSMPPDWHIYSERLNSLSPEEMNIFEILGFSETYITKRMIGHVLKKEENDYSARRFYLTLILHDLWNQNSTFNVALKYNFSRGQIQSLLQSAVTLSACIANFVVEFRTDLWAFKELFPKFTIRLSHCVSSELIPLMEINGIRKGRAQLLYQAGYDSIAKIASSESKSLVKLLAPITHKAVSAIISSSKMIIREKLESLNEEYKDLIVSSNNIASDDNLNNNENKIDLNFPLITMRKSTMTSSTPLKEKNNIRNKIINNVENKFVSWSNTSDLFSDVDELFNSGIFND